MGMIADTRGAALTVVVPSFNEAENLPGVLREIDAAMRAAGVAGEILVVDDGSTDDTAAAFDVVANELGGRARLVRHERNLGLGAALKTGFSAAETPWMGWLPADGQFSPEDLLALHAAREGAVAVAGRVAVPARRKADRMGRVILSLGLRVVMRALHPNIPDFNGVLVVRRDVFDARRLVCRTGFVNMEILDRIRRAGSLRRVRELKVSVRPRRTGVSKVANSRTIRIVVEDLFRLRLAYLAGSARPRRVAKTERKPAMTGADR
jgi:dolichol-phosphate mannosyltransferase